jgi:hypothetical protein
MHGDLDGSRQAASVITSDFNLFFDTRRTAGSRTGGAFTSDLFPASCGSQPAQLRVRDEGQEDHHGKQLGIAPAHRQHRSD